MKAAVVVGTRPEVIKMAPVIRALRAREIHCLVIHTGQHTSFEMNALLFQELELPDPHHDLGTGAGSTPRQLAAVLARIEPVLRRERPDVVLVEGDTNSVLGAALAASALGLRVGHVEAGLRSFDRGMPEERNRVLTDHLADHLFAPTENARRNLLREGIEPARVVVTGNTVVDELLRQRRRARHAGLPRRFGVEPGRYALATVHRVENVEDEERLGGIFEGIFGTARSLGLPVLCALHPRTARRLKESGIQPRGSARFLPPLGYLPFLGLLERAELVLTDSGGVQEEACVFHVPCVTLRDSTERPEAVEVGASVLAGADPRRIERSARRLVGGPRDWPNPFGDGRSGRRIADFLRALPAGTAGAAGAPRPEGGRPGGMSSHRPRHPGRGHPKR